MFKAAKLKFGAVKEVHRGDASTGRRQACFVSTGNEEKIHFILEEGEVNSSFYLFAGGPDWYGSDRCVPSNLVSRKLATASGLHLGQRPAQVVAILGRPSTRRKEEITYSLHLRKKSSAADLASARRMHPEMSDKDLEENYGYYDWNVGIAAKFSSGKLTFLSISLSETT